MSKIIKNLFKRAHQNKLSIIQLAEMSGVSKSTLYRWEKRLPKCLEDYERVRETLKDYEKSQNLK